MEENKLLSMDYERFSNLFLKNEEIGEKRVTFFITISTAAIGGIITLLTKETHFSKIEINLICITALFSVLFIGILTYKRILKRNKVTDEYKNILNYIHSQLKNNSTTLQNYTLPFNHSSGRFLQGGLADLIACMNSLLLAFIVFIFIGMNWQSLFIAFIVSIAFFLIHIKISTTKKEQSQTFRAGCGAIIYHSSGKILALERKKNLGSWQLPQGGIKNSEYPLKTIYREIEEETGILKKHLTIKNKKPELLVYDLPPKYVNIKTGRGQAIYWYRFDFTGTEKDITLGNKIEFANWKWMTPEELIKHVAIFKTTMYNSLFGKT